LASFIPYLFYSFPLLAVRRWCKLWGFHGDVSSRGLLDCDFPDLFILVWIQCFI